VTANPTPDTTELQPVSSEVAAAENAHVRSLFGGGDNPNPELGSPEPVTPPPAEETGEQEQERPLSVREQIAQRAKAARKAAETEAGEITQNDMGEYVPPFLAKKAEEAPAEEEGEKKPTTEEAPQTFELKVRGNSHNVSFEELAKIAGLEVEEAKEIPTRSLVKAAQLAAAAEDYFSEAKQAHRSSRHAAREDADDTLSETKDGQDHDESANRGVQHQDADEFRETIEKIQFGDPEEAAQALRDALQRGVKEALTTETIGQRVQTVERYIDRAAVEFEEQNQDLVNDEDLADLLYNKALLKEFRKDLVAGGIDPKRVDAQLGDNVNQAMKVYIAVAADGRVKVRTPDLMLKAAAEAVRTKFNLPAPSTEPAKPQPGKIPPMSARTDAKRNLAPQPSRASVPQTTTAPKNGQAPEARSRVVAKMAAQRGRGSLAA
jgi:hypothetical protein